MYFYVLRCSLCEIMPVKNKQHLSLYAEEFSRVQEELGVKISEITESNQLDQIGNYSL